MPITSQPTTLCAQCQRIALNPLGYRLRSELGDNIRSCAHGHHVIFFESDSDAVVIVRILHGARDIPAVFDMIEVAPESWTP